MIVSDNDNLPPASIPVDIEVEMKNSYLDYAMSVIIGRALPDVRDGLKPVHRRVLYAMNDLGNTIDKPYKKSARIVGDVIGKYHPHGDMAVYDTIVRMAQNFSMRYLLVDGQGNFGSVDGDSPAAMRYTEIRMSKITNEILADLDKNTVDFVPNYDDTLSEPEVLPTRIPNLLLNGSSGIAVGMATNVPPHNLIEVIDAVIHIIHNPDANVHDLVQFVRGPDFPTRGIICGKSEILKAYHTGRGIIQLRARAEFGEGIKARPAIIVTELPYQVNKARLIESIANLMKDKVIEGIHDIRDESDRDGLRVVIELKKDAQGDVVLNQLYKHTQLQTSFGINMLAIVHGQPKTLTLKEILYHFLTHRKEVVTRRTRFELDKAMKRFHLLIGLVVATDVIDRLIAIIRASNDINEARSGIMAERFPSTALLRLQPFLTGDNNEFEYRDENKTNFSLTYAQAQAILELRLHRLTGLERDKLIEETKEVSENIAYYQSILGSETVLLKVIEDELIEIKNNYSDERKTEIIDDVNELLTEDLIPVEEVVVTVSHAGYIKRAPIDTYKVQHRGGKGIIGSTVRDEDFVETLFTASTHDYVLVFTNNGKLYWLKVFELPSASRISKGRAITNLLPIEPSEKIAAIVSVKEFDDTHHLLTVTQKGIVKKTHLSAYSKPRSTGIIGCLIDEGDNLIAAKITNGTQDIFLGTKLGMGIRFHEGQVRDTGRASVGVKGISLDDNDEVIGVEVLIPGLELLAVTNRGYGKRTDINEFRSQGRAGKGLITMKLTPKNGDVIGVRQIRNDQDIMIITEAGRMIRIPGRSVSVIGRNTQGVRLINLEENEKVASFSPVEETTVEDIPTEEIPPNDTPAELN